jgi:hypothetical protein
VANYCHVITRGSAERTTVTSLLFDVADDCTFGDGAKRENVADSQVGVLAGVDELTSVHALIGNEDLSPILEFVGVSEGDSSERSAATGIVDDFLDYTTDVAMSLGEVELSELRRGLVQTSVGGCLLLALNGNLCENKEHTEDRAAALSLVPNNSTHGAIESEKPLVVLKGKWSTAVKVESAAAFFASVVTLGAVNAKTTSGLTSALPQLHLSLHSSSTTLTSHTDISCDLADSDFTTNASCQQEWLSVFTWPLCKCATSIIVMSDGSLRYWQNASHPSPSSARTQLDI